jgi:hypothetical protein
VAGLAVTAAPVAAAPAAPAAAPIEEETVPRVKAALTARIDLRLAALHRDLARVDASRALTDEHRQELSSVVNGAIAGLTALKGTVAGETTLAALRADAQSMVNDYRVFKLIGPKVRLTIAGDFTARGIDRAQQAHDKLAELLAQEEAEGTDVTAAETDLAEMQAAIEAARGHLEGQVAALLAIDPGPDGVAITNAVAAVRRSIGATRGDLRTAVAEGRAVARFLRANR